MVRSDAMAELFLGKPSKSHKARSWCQPGLRTSHLLFPLLPVKSADRVWQNQLWRSQENDPHATWNKLILLLRSWWSASFETSGFSDTFKAQLFSMANPCIPILYLHWFINCWESAGTFPNLSISICARLLAAASCRGMSISQVHPVRSWRC